MAFLISKKSEKLKSRVQEIIEKGFITREN